MQSLIKSDMVKILKFLSSHIMSALVSSSELNLLLTFLSFWYISVMLISLQTYYFVLVQRYEHYLQLFFNKSCPASLMLTSSHVVIVVITKVATYSSVPLVTHLNLLGQDGWNSWNTIQDLPPFLTHLLLSFLFFSVLISYIFSSWP